VVTGCTEGIGLSFALELAKMDFGIVFVARNKDKLKKRI
jgi:short-subunit dehydrogenase